MFKEYQIYDNLHKTNEHIDSTYLKKLKNQYDSLKNEEQNIRINFTRKYPDSFISLYLLFKYMDLSNELTKEIYNGLSDNLKRHSIGKDVHYQLFEIEKIDSQTLSFSLPDTSGKMINIDSFKGNYFLVDFWASWCGPCRTESLNLKKAYNDYKGKGFEIIAISLDSKKENWVNAIKNDNLNWIHLSSLMGWESPIVKKYGITSIPYNFLLDKEEKIIAKNLKGEELLKKLSELYK
jgi:peroxiredoxin